MDIKAPPLVVSGPREKELTREDLFLPDAEQVPVSTLAGYTVPQEFWDAKNQNWRFDNAPKFSGIFKSVEQFFQTTLSLGSIVPKPRNAVDFLMHPLDYAEGRIEENSEYTYFDEDWKAAQVATAGASVAGAFALSAWAGGKNVDGSGRAKFFRGERDLFNGRHALGSLPLTAIMFSLFMVGCTLASQHRPLMDDGNSSAEAYFLAAFPLTAWPLTWWDDEHYFVDYTYASFNAGAFSMLYSQYLSRLVGIMSILSYSVVWSDDLLPAFERHLAFARAEQFGKKTFTPQTQQVRVLLGNFDTSYSGQAGIERMQREQQLLQGKVAELEHGKNTLTTELLKRPKDSYLITRLGAVRRELRHLTYYQRYLDHIVSRLQGGETVHFAAEIETGQVRRLATLPFRGFSRQSAAQAGRVLDLLEEVRNRRLRFTPAEHLALYRHSRLARVGYGMVSGFTHGRWRVRLTSYGAGSLVGWLSYAVIYHYQWDKSWSESFLSSTSFFYTLLLNEPWIGMLKGSGIQRVPYALQYLPSAAAVNLVQSAVVWDRDIMLQRCKADRANLLRSQDPEWRAQVRSRLARWYRLANEKEQAQWTLPLEDGGCGLPVPGS